MQDACGAVSPTRTVCQLGYGCAVKTLLAAGADINARNKGGQTPLHRAALNSENPAVVRVLLDAGVNLNAKTNHGKTPFDLIPNDSPLKGTDVYWLLRDATF